YSTACADSELEPNSAAAATFASPFVLRIVLFVSLDAERVAGEACLQSRCQHLMASEDKQLSEGTSDLCKKFRHHSPSFRRSRMLVGVVPDVTCRNRIRYGVSKRATTS